jgi:hypothetical protein
MRLVDHVCHILVYDLDPKQVVEAISIDLHILFTVSILTSRDNMFSSSTVDFQSSIYTGS